LTFGIWPTGKRGNVRSASGRVRDQHSLSYTRAIVGCGFGASDACTTHRWPSCRLSFVGDRAHPATSFGAVLAVRRADQRARRCSIRVGLALSSASCRSRRPIGSSRSKRRDPPLEAETYGVAGRPRRLEAPNATKRRPKVMRQISASTIDGYFIRDATENSPGAGPCRSFDYRAQRSLGRLSSLKN
jgi:hypothetical protein